MSRTRRSREQWHQLIHEYEQSGLSQAEFCNAQQINPKYFSLKRSKLHVADGHPSPGFVRVSATSPAFPQAGIVVQVGAVRMTLPEHISPGALAQLVKALT